MQCDMSLGFSYGTNRGFTPTYESKEVLGEQTSPSSDFFTQIPETLPDEPKINEPEG